MLAPSRRSRADARSGLALSGARTRPITVLLLVALVASTTAACARGPRSSSPEPAERALWARAATEEDQLLRKVKPYDDPALAAYLSTLAERLYPSWTRSAGSPELRVVVLPDPTLGAFSMPDGRVFVHTGLLSHVENEAQLATVIGRELSHVAGNHAARLSRDRKRARAAGAPVDATAAFGLAALAGIRTGSDDPGAAVLGPTAGAVLGLGLRQPAIAAIAGYGPDLEREADAQSMERLVSAGYDPREARRLFERLRDDAKHGGAMEAFLYGRAPWLEQRVESARRLLATRYARVRDGEIVDTAEFDRRMLTVVRDNAALDTRAGRFSLAQRQLDRVLAATPRDPIAHLDAGDLQRLQSQRAGSVAERRAYLAKAVESYERAAELDLTYAAPFRQLGLLYYQQSDVARAREAFQKYLALEPAASDAQRIGEYLAELGRRP